MFKLTVDDKAVTALLRAMPKVAGRAAEIALDKTAKDIKVEMISTMKKVFTNPTRYTLNSLKVTRTQNHNMQASVWFKEPDRMGQHYLVPQVDGGPRKYKGFEHGLGRKMMVPAVGAKILKHGAVSYGQLRTILSVLGRAERTAGYSANITARSSKRNRRARDYVRIKRKYRGLYPGVYERYQTGVGFGAKTKRTFAHGHKVYQKGRRRGRFASVIQARGLRPVLLEGKQKASIKPLLPFYKVAGKVGTKQFKYHFYREFDRLLAR